MKHVSIKQAKDQRPALVREVEAGKRVVITRKVRQGKLEMPAPLAKLEERLDRLGCTVLPITAAHAVSDVTPWPPTNDPFDRLLLAVCPVEGLRLLTRDRKLIDHPLAWRSGSA